MTTPPARPLMRFDETRAADGGGRPVAARRRLQRLPAGRTALVIDRAEGAIFHDVDGNRLIDYYLGAGPIILGHTPAPVVEAVTRQISRGVQVGGETAEEYEAARSS